MKDTSDKKPSLTRQQRNKKNRPNIVHPTIPGAVGSTESPYREGRDTDDEAAGILEDTINKIRGGS